MKFTFDGAVFLLEFSRERKPVVVESRTGFTFAPSTYPYTTTTLWKIVPGSPPELYRTATVGCWFKERGKFTLEKGRLHALRVMSKTLTPDFKEVMWKAYINRKDKAA